MTPMQKNYIHDIKPSGRTQKRREAFHRAHERRMHEVEETYDDRRYESGGGSSRGMWYIAAFALAALVFALTYVFAGATITVTPRTGSVELSGPILAEKESRSGLSFEMLVLDAEESSSVAAGEKRYVERKATGRVRLFNDHSSSPQKLLIDTRLESPEGRIYKTKTPVTIPGQTIAGGKKTPGSVEVDIYADEAGEAYNTTESDFKIVGFRGSPKYEHFYARSITPISGGFRGDTYDIGDDVLASETERLRAALREKLVEQAGAELPTDFVMYEDVATFLFDEPVVEEGSDGSVVVRQGGVMNAVIFKESDLTDAIVDRVIADKEDNRVRIPNIRELTIMLDPKSVITDPESMTDIKLLIDSRVEVVWEVEEVAIKEALAGSKKRTFDSTMLSFKNIDKAELKLKPFWRSSLPEKVGSIKIINTLENGDQI